MNLVPPQLAARIQPHLTASKQRLQRASAAVDSAATSSWEARVCVLATILLVVAMTVPDQSIDAFRGIAENRVAAHAGRWERWVVPWLFVGCQFLLAFALWFWSRISLEVSTGAAGGRSAADHWAVRWVPRGCAAGPFAAALIGWMKASSTTPGQGFAAMIIGSSVAAVVFFTAVVTRSKFLRVTSAPAWAQIRESASAGRSSGSRPSRFSSGWSSRSS